MSPIIVALDNLNKTESLSMAKELSENVWGFKVHYLLTREGFSLIKELKEFGKVFVDLKFHDIPETVKNEVSAIVDYGADLVSVHASGGEKMLKSAYEAGGEKIVAITALTSLSEEEVDMIYHINSEKVVAHLADIANNVGIKNIVCSPNEIAVVKKINPNLHVITPGIRNEKIDDQSRTMSAKEAKNAGSDLLVIGRPITKAPNPSLALSEIISSLN